MASRAAREESSNEIHAEDPHKTGDIDLLREDFERLADRTQTLLTEKLLLENEVTQLSKRASRLEEDLRHLKSPPLVVVSVQDSVDDRAIVNS